jgi:hypothetical protein
MADTHNEAGLNIILTGLLDAGFAAYTANPFNAANPLPADITTVRAFQNRQQGANITATVYFEPQDPKPVGYTGRKSNYDQTSGQMISVEGNRYETTYHIEALVPQSPADINAMTESDVLDIARFILQSEGSIATLAAQNIGVLRVTGLQSNYIVDDKGQNENVPFFEVTFSYRRELSTTVPMVEAFDTVFNRV